jgi:hypothetical protein
LLHVALFLFVFCLKKWATTLTVFANCKNARAAVIFRRNIDKMFGFQKTVLQFFGARQQKEFEAILLNKSTMARVKLKGTMLGAPRQ